MGNTNWEISGIANSNKWASCNKGDIIYFSMNSTNWISTACNSIGYINCVNTDEHGIIPLTWNTNGNNVVRSTSERLISCNSSSNDIYIDYWMKCNIKTGKVINLSETVNFRYNPLNNYNGHPMVGCTCGDNNDNIYYVSLLSNNSRNDDYYTPVIMKYNTKTNAISLFANLPNGNYDTNSEYGGSRVATRLRFDPIANSIIAFQQNWCYDGTTARRGWCVQMFWLNGILYSNSAVQMTTSVYTGNNAWMYPQHHNFPIWENRYSNGSCTYFTYYSYWPNVTISSNATNLVWYSNVINGTNKQYALRYYDHDTGKLYSMYIPNGTNNDVWWMYNAQPIPTTYYPQWTY